MTSVNINECVLNVLDVNSINSAHNVSNDYVLFYVYEGHINHVATVTNNVASFEYYGFNTGFCMENNTIQNCNIIQNSSLVDYTEKCNS
jgi:hypothetical protein